MSRKLLMCNGKIVGFIYDRECATENVEGTVEFEDGLINAYSYALVKEVRGNIAFNPSSPSTSWNDVYSIGEYDEESGKYVYELYSSSVRDPKKIKTVQFSLDRLLTRVDRGADYGGVYADRIYWDEQAKEYMLEIKTRYDIFTETNSTAADWDYIQYYILYKKLPTTLSIDGGGTPLVVANRPFTKKSSLVYNSGVGVYETSGNALYSDPNNPGNIYFVTSEQFIGSDSYYLPYIKKHLHIVYAVESTIVPTGIKKQMKLPLFEGGTNFGIKHVNKTYSNTTPQEATVTLYGGVTLDVKCTDAIVYESFEGESITPSFSSDTHVFCEDEPIYLEEVNGIHSKVRRDNVTTATFIVNDVYTLGVPTNDGKYEYTVTATSADGLKSKDTKFSIDYQLIFYGEKNRMYWNDALGCYDVYMHSGYEYVTNVDDWSITTYDDYTIFTKQTDDGNVAYGGGNSNAVYADGSLNAGSRNSLSAYYYMITNGGFDDGTVLGLSFRGIHDYDAANDIIAENGPIHIYYEYNTPKTYHTNIKKKIKLPWFGEGTTYTLTNGDIASTFKVGLPTKYEHKIAYKEYTSLEMHDKTDMTTTIQPTIKDLDVYDICYSYDSYIDTIINPVRLHDGGGYDVAIDNGDGTYSYNIEATSRTINPDTGGAIITSLFTQEIKLPYYIDAWFQSTTYNGRDRFYWDDNAGQYMLEKNSMRVVIDSAYGDVEFKPFSYSSYNLNKGNCWEFALPDGCDAALINVGYSSPCRLNTNYQWSNMTVAYIYDDDGVIFHPDYHSTFEDDKSLVFHYQYATTLDLLDQQLKTKPLILILPIPEPITIATGIKKKITLPFTQSMCEVGVQVTMKNTNSAGTIINSAEALTNGIITIKVPVEYKTIEVPEPTYQLPAKTVLSGSSSGGYINTNVKLFDTAKDSTVIIDFQNVNANGSFTPDNGDIVFHCRYESSSYKYRGFALVYENTYNSWRMMGDTTYNSGNLGSYSNACISDSSRETYCWRYRYAFIFKAGILDRAINLSAESISSIDIPAPAVFYDEELFANKAAYGAYNNPAYIGRKGTSNANYYQGTIHDCKIWDGVALTDAQIQALYCRPYPKTSYAISNTAANTNNKIHTGVELFEVARDFTMAISFTPSYDTYIEDKAVLSCGVYGKNVHRLSIIYDEDLRGYTLMGCGLTQNILGTDTLIPQSATGKIALLITYKNGEPSEIIDYSSGECKSLTIASGLTAYSVPSISLPLTIGYRQFSTSDTATNHDVCQVWDGTIHNCIIWKDKTLNKAEMEYVCKYILK